MNISIEIIPRNDVDSFRELIRVFEKVFEMKDFKMPGDKHLRDLLNKPDFFALVAKEAEAAKVVAGLTVYIIHQYYAERPLAYIYDLAVLKSHQRQGIGKALIAYLTAHCRQQGFEEVFVQADLVDDYALDFYRATRPTAEEQVIHFYYLLRS
jgi:aminoglycoside 3-N-acetyltransferase I